MDVFDQQRTWERAVRLSLAQLVCLGRHSISNLLCACGRQFQDWSADYRLFSSDRWDAQRLFRPVLAGVLAMSPPTATWWWPWTTPTSESPASTPPAWPIAATR